MADAKAKKPTPWWLTRGTEVCEHCHQRYHYHRQYRCADCDGPLCPECVIKVKSTGDVYCVNCTPEEEQS